MQGDFSRIPSDRGKNYTAVLQQQGRVALDADANEQCFIDAHRSRTQIVDAIGQFGGPAGDEGFAITVVDDNEIYIGPGRYYVNGLLCENPASLSYDSQPYLVDPANSGSSLLAQLRQPGNDSVLQVYLEVWQRLVTALDDPCLLEPALGQADTTVRVQTVWRVVADPVTLPQPQAGQTGPAPSCCQDMYAAPAAQASTGTMTAGLAGPAAECGCGPVAAAGYQGIENQLYRVQILTGGDETQATWVWSRENGSIVTAITGISGSTVTVGSLGLDANLGFQAGQWVELTDDTLEFGQPSNAPGTLYQIQSINKTDLSATLAVPPGQTISVDPTQNARMRRWDMSGPAVTAAGIPVSAGSWIQLENGIQVQFGPPPTGPGAPPIIFNSGDYWTIPARTATGQIEWPPCGSDQNPAQLPTSILVYRAPLACIHPPLVQQLDRTIETGLGIGIGPVVFYRVDDCRQVFSTLTALAAVAQAIHVTSVSWVNDDITTLDELQANGLVVYLDQTPSGPVSGANFIVTIEAAYLPGNGDTGTSAGSATTRFVWDVDAQVGPDGQAISWQLSAGGASAQQIIISFLNDLISPGATYQLFARVRVRLLGQMIFASGSSGQIYLDGRAYGQPALRQDGVTPRVDLQFPSGIDAVSSDFDGWFYLAPTLALESLSFNFSAPAGSTAPPGFTIEVDFLGGVTGEQSNGQAVSPTVTIGLNYPAVTSAEIMLTPITSSYVSIPTSVWTQIGQSSVSFPIAVAASPGDGTTDTYQITATYNPAAGPASTQTASFTITGGAQPGPPIIRQPFPE